MLQREAVGTPSNVFNQNTISGSGVQDTNTRLMAHMLGLEIPGVETSTSCHPGYEWWPRPNQPDLSMPASQSTSIADQNILLPLNKDDGSVKSGSAGRLGSRICSRPQWSELYLRFPTVWRLIGLIT